MAKASNEWLQLLQAAWLCVMLLLVLLLLNGCAELLAEPSLVPAVQRQDREGLLLLMMMGLRRQLRTACCCKHARQLLEVWRCVIP